MQNQQELIENQHYLCNSKLGILQNDIESPQKNFKKNFV